VNSSGGKFNQPKIFSGRFLRHKNRADRPARRVFSCANSAELPFSLNNG